jgi:glyoxylate/hydroxypyruvate reductase
MSTTGTTNNTSLEVDSKNEEKPKVLLLQSIGPLFDSTLSAKFDLVRAHESPLPLPTFLSAHCHHIKALLTMVPIFTVDSALLDQLPSIGLVAASSVGVDHINLDACRERGVSVTNAGETFTPDVADFAVGLLIDALRKVTIADRYVKNGFWMVKGDHPLGSKVRCIRFSFSFIFFNSQRFKEMIRLIPGVHIFY